MAIKRFTGKYKFLSNFYPSTISFERELYPTVEHAFQAAKTFDTVSRARIRRAPTPAKAKRLGRRVPLREGWNEARVPLMKELLRCKFEDSQLRDTLLATGDTPLEEGNNWGDRFWGVCEGQGENMLGRLLMEVREEIQQEAYRS